MSHHPWMTLSDGHPIDLSHFKNDCGERSKLDFGVISDLANFIPYFFYIKSNWEVLVGATYLRYDVMFTSMLITIGCTNYHIQLRRTVYDHVIVYLFSMHIYFKWDLIASHAVVDLHNYHHNRQRIGMESTKIMPTENIPLLATELLTTPGDYSKVL